MSALAFNVREIYTGDGNIRIVTLLQQNGGIFRIPVVCFHFVGKSSNQNR